MQIEKVAVLTDWFNESNEHIGVLSADARAARLRTATSTCQYCLGTATMLYVEKTSSSFSMHCRDCLDHFELIEQAWEDEKQKVLVQCSCCYYTTRVEAEEADKISDNWVCGVCEEQMIIDDEDAACLAYEQSQARRFGY